MKHLAAKIGLLFLICLLSVNAKASLIGDDVTLEVLRDGFPFLDPQTRPVGARVEFQFVELFIDIGAETIDFVIDLPFPSSWNSDFDFVFSDLDWVGVSGEIVGLVVSPFQGAGTATFTADSVMFSVPEGGSFVPGNYASIELITRHAAPAPASLALLGVGLAALRWSRPKPA